MAPASETSRRSRMSASIKITAKMTDSQKTAAKAWNARVSRFRKDDREMFELGVNSKCLKCRGLCKQASFATIVYCPQYKKA